ncbi:MAG TPA: hypothetical protein VE954_40810, partial [Oligoflexus sp.]|uniref:hypothetical protein n=1 Tax=Oligoflexus sp. TaxID=1971216 RepID=UPI002D5C88B9
SPTGNRETLFRISSAFSEAQKAKIRSGLDVAMRAVGSHFNEKYVNKRSQSPFQECVKKHTRSYIEPINAAIKGQDAAFYADIAMSGVTLLQNFHEFRDIPVDISPINFPVTDTVVVAQAYLGQDSTHVGATQNMNFKINVHALDLAFIDAQSLGGTVVHEWLHRLGFDHPQDDTGTLVEIAGQCVHYDYDVGPSAGLLGGLDIIR